MKVMSKGVLDCDAPHAFAEGKMYPSLTLAGSKGHRKDLSVYPKNKKYSYGIFIIGQFVWQCI